MSRLKKLAGVIKESHGKVVAKSGEFKVEHNGDTLYFYDGENTVRMDIPVDDLFDIVINLMRNIPDFDPCGYGESGSYL